MKYCLRVAVAAATLLGGPAYASYKVEVNTLPGWLTTARRIAVVPAVCPPDVDCAWLNDKIADEIAKRPLLQTVDSRRVSQALFEAGVDTLTAESRAAISLKLGVQSFLVVTVGHSEVKQEGAVGIPIGGIVIMAPTDSSIGSIDVRVIGSDGKMLAKGTGFGESGMRGQKGVLGATFVKILDKLVPRTLPRGRPPSKPPAPSPTSRNPPAPVPPPPTRHVSVAPQAQPPRPEIRATIESKIASQTEATTVFAWVLQITSTATLSANAEVQFLDSGGFVVASSHERGLQLAAGATSTYRGTTELSAAIAASVARVAAKVVSRHY